MGTWTGLFDRYLDGEFSGLDRDGFLERYGWVEEYATRAGEVLSPAALSSMAPHEIYAALDSLNLPRCQVRMTNLGRMNVADGVVEGIRNLLEKPGDFAVKYRAGKIPQAGVVTMTQILTLARPDRFAIRNAPMTRALARQVPLYSARGLDELGYEEFLDICRELTRVVGERVKRFGLGEWALRYRFLLLYAILVGKEK